MIGESWRRGVPGLLAVCLLATAFSAPASDGQMADEAIMPYAPNDPDKRARHLQQHYDRITDLAARKPDEIQPATVFFNRGLSYRETGNLRSAFGIEIIDVSLKAPMGNNGTVMSISGGMADLFAIEGTFEERLRFMVESEQKCFAKSAGYREDETAQGMAEVANRPFLVYGARIFGPARALADLQEQADVRCVLLNLRPSIISDFEGAKARRGEPHRYFMPGFHC